MPLPNRLNSRTITAVIWLGMSGSTSVAQDGYIGRVIPVGMLTSSLCIGVCETGRTGTEFAPARPPAGEPGVARFGLQGVGQIVLFADRVAVFVEVVDLAGGRVDGVVAVTAGGRWDAVAAGSDIGGQRRGPISGATWLPEESTGAYWSPTCR